ncbi:serine-threonine rich protein [Aspergillus niger]|uniref:Uncharacterized protein n=3 Tax=Aspergillus niger TaxID=5061 RepID=A2R2H5_ASPNC|nr:hypothetical protein An14g00760 [Aspergillus niger]XP_025451774.1 uncharacterized protein BO96DRAFT_414410 [Aspergillus niger CBS 101883]RDH26025.1 hypothetical protein M747DRAFT_291724 [Aspergillus niger ATCC 13496]PYH53719.1 hypothetical protein BO96DRAFT_414410 [Aspergillus niger CBS 101883]CAK41875.1 hypothetical protein An14g00760 [Aspergillus niger]GJP93467.1 serine-threonine rich protein [Aspergillus niger]
MVYPSAVSDIRAVKRSVTHSRAVLFASSRLLRSSYQRRHLWRGPGERINYDYLEKQMDRHRRYCLSKLREKPARPRKANVYESHHPWWFRGFGPGYDRDKPFQFDHRSGIKGDFWEAERSRIKDRMDQIKREIDNDPYAALFGRRLQPFSSFEKLDNAFTSLCRSFLGLGKSESTMDTTARPKATAAASKDSSESPKKPNSKMGGGVPSSDEVVSGINRPSYEFDPVSGRMIPKGTEQPVATEEGFRGSDIDASVGSQKPHSGPTGYLSPFERSAIESKSATVSGNERAEERSHQGVEAVPVADEPYQAPEVLKSDPPTEARYKALEPSIDALKDQRDVAEKVNGLSEAIMADQPKPQGEYTNGGTYDHLEAPVNSRPFGDQQSHEVLMRPPDAPGSTLSTAQEQERVQAERDEDLDILSASDIRSHYLARPSIDPEIEKQIRQSLDDRFDSFVDPAGDIDAQSVRSKFQKHETVGADRPEVSDIGVQPDQQTAESREPSQVLQAREQGSAQRFDQTAIIEQPLADSPSTETYRVLAYDPSTLQVNEAETSSSFHASDETIHPAEILGRLNAPAKFLPHFARMRTDGYEIVSGGGDILVFRKASSSVHDNAPSKAADKIETSPDGQNNGALKQSTSPIQLSQEHISSQAPDHEVQLSDGTSQAQGSSYSSSKGQSRVGQALRRMLFSGVATAGTCYAISVVVEYFRTGGQDGRGIDAFTAFESERRHGD